jgi:hypothetical protein
MVPRHSLTKHQLCANTHYMGGPRTRCPTGTPLRDAVRCAAGSRTGRARPPGGVSTFRHKPPPGGGRRVVEGFAIRIRTETPGSVDERDTDGNPVPSEGGLRAPLQRALQPGQCARAETVPHCASDRSSRSGEGCRSGRALARTPAPRRGQPPCMAGAGWTLADTPAFNGGTTVSAVVLEGTRRSGMEERVRRPTKPHLRRARCRGYRAAWAARPRRAASVVEHRRAELTEAMTENG